MSAASGASPAASGPSARLSAEERRDAIVAAALVEFARGGLAGTSTEAIARRAGVSQPYLFQLFGTKKELFIAVVRRCFARTTMAFQAAGRQARGAGRQARAAAADPAEILRAMGAAYGDLIEDRDLLLLQLHAYAACGDPEIRTIVHDEFAGLYREVSRLSGADAESLDRWFAYGMLCNLGTAIGLPEIRPFSLASLAGGGPAA
jgi:AcrR family transcriptional regulator